MRTRHALGFALVSTLALTSSFALADTLVQPGEGDSLVAKPTTAAQVLLVAHGNYGRMTGDMRLNYAGHEMIYPVITDKHITVLAMESTTEPNLGPVQCTCNSYELQAAGAPKLVASRRLTEYPNGERRCNKPRGAADENGNIVMSFGSDFDSDRPRLYAGVINNKCEQLAAFRVVSVEAPNVNIGAPSMTYQGGGKFLTSAYFDGNNNDPFPNGDHMVAIGLQLNTSGVLPELTMLYNKNVLDTGNQMRPSLVRVSANRAIGCAMVGGGRPGDSIACALFNSDDGTVITRNTFYRMSQGGNGVARAYFNQPEIARLADNQYALMAIESSGTGKNTDIQASNITHILPISLNGDTMVAGNEIVGVGVHQSHASICAGPYGQNGAPAVGLLQGAKWGVGRGLMSMVTFDPGSQSFAYNDKENLWPVSWHSDSGKLANLYGRNPMNQGRDFISCVGGVANPGYHQPNGFMADVKSFFVATLAGRRPGDRANSAFLSLVPGEQDVKVTPQNPVPAGEVPVTEPDPTANTKPAPKSDSGCGCSTPGTSNTSGLAAMGGLALGLGLVISRRRRSK